VDLLYAIQLVKAVLRELWRHKYPAVLTGIATAYLAMGYGYMWNENYEVTTKLFADRQNIIRPLLAGRAPITRVENRTQVVRDVMLSTKNLEKVVRNEGFLTGGEGAAAQAAIVSGLRGRVNVRMLGENYISVAFSDTDPERAYNVITSLVSAFVTESSSKKKHQSKQAFLFIDRQANSYKEQLQQAEDSLKEFKANNLDGTESRVTGRIDNLRLEISNIELELERVVSF